jgi:hypothetical protein
MEKEEIHLPFDSPLRWQVPSSSESDIHYLVDLGANDGLGECQCSHFVFVCGPRIRQGERRRCRHINLARSWFLDWSIEAFKNHDKNKEHD